MLKGLGGFITEIVAAVIIFLGLTMYPEVTWLHALAFAVALALTVLGVIVMVGMMSALYETKRQLGRASANWLSIEYTVALRFAKDSQNQLNMWLSFVGSVALITAMAVGGRPFLAILYFLFPELILSRILHEMTELHNKHFPAPEADTKSS